MPRPIWPRNSSGAEAHDGKRVRTLLLSAMPYKLYTADAEIEHESITRTSWPPPGSCSATTTRASVSRSMRLRRSPVLPPFVVHVKPVRVPQPDYGARHVAALVLVVEPGRQHRLDPERVATTLELTPVEARVAVWRTEGKSVRDIAEATGQSQGAIYWHRKLIYRKQSLSRQADLVRLVLFARRARVRRRIRSRRARPRRARLGPRNGNGVTAQPSGRWPGAGRGGRSGFRRP